MKISKNDIRFLVFESVRQFLNEEESDISNIIHSEAFKRWFGDWENNPEAASKAVDQNGVPLLVHHGSPHFIGDKFDKSKTGYSANYGEKGLFCTTADMDWARRFSYPARQGKSAFSVVLDKSKQGDILSGFLRLMNPLDFFNLSESDIKNMWEMTKESRRNTGFSDYGSQKDYEKWLSDINSMLKYRNHQGLKFEISHGSDNFGEKLKRYGYDGLIANMDNHDKNNPVEYCFIEPSQFKSVSSKEFKVDDDNIFRE